MPDDKRPHVIALYFEHVDTATHRYGPGSKRSISSIKRVDAYLGRLLAGIDKLSIADDIYVVIVSDHGQTSINSNADPFLINTVVSIDGITVVDHGSVAFLYLPEPDRQRSEAIRTAINNAWEHGKAMLHHETPDTWHVVNNSRFADIIVQADLGYVVYSSRKRSWGGSIGDHGWAPEHKEMHGIFLANGPRLPKGRKIPAVNAVDVYPLMMEILEIPLTMPIDGDREILTRLLSPRSN